MKLRNTLFSVVAAATLMGSAAMGAVSQGAPDATSSVTIVTSGTFSASLSATDFGEVPYSLTPQYARNGSISLAVNDMTGRGAGWTVEVRITDFVGQTRNSEVIPSENLEIDPLEITVQPGADGTAPWSPANMPLVYQESEPQLVWTANSGYGAGRYVLTMQADLLIPGGTTVQTYISSGYVTANAAP